MNERQVVVTMALRIARNESWQAHMSHEALEEAEGSEGAEGSERTLMTLEGDLDLATAGQLHERLDELARAGITRIALDLSDLQFLDSTGLSVLLTEHHRVEALGGELVILSPTRRVRRVFQITGLDRYLNIRPEKPLPPSP